MKKLYLKLYEAILQQRKQEEALNNFVKAMHPDNQAYMLDNPFQQVLEEHLKELNEDLYDWFSWYVYETATKYKIKKIPYDKSTQTLEEFLDTVCQ